MPSTRSEDDDNFGDNDDDDDVILIKDDTIPLSQQHYDIGMKIPESQTQASIGQLQVNKTHHSYLESSHRSIKRRNSTFVPSNNDAKTNTDKHDDRNRDKRDTSTQSAKQSNIFRDLENLLDRQQQSQHEYHNTKEKVHKHKRQSPKKDDKITRASTTKTHRPTQDENNNTDNCSDNNIWDDQRKKKRKSTDECSRHVSQINMHSESVEYNIRTTDSSSTSKSRRRHSTGKDVIIRNNKSAEKHMSIVQNRNSIVGSRPLHWTCNDNTQQQEESSRSRRDKLARAVCTSLISSSSFSAKMIMNQQQQYGPSTTATTGSKQQQQQFKTPIDTSKTKKRTQQQNPTSRDSTKVFRPTALAQIIANSEIQSQQKKIHNNSTVDRRISRGSGHVDDTDYNLVITTEDDDPSFHSSFDNINQNKHANNFSSINIHNSFTVSTKEMNNEQQNVVETISTDNNTCDINYESPPLTTSKGKRKQIQSGPYSQRLKYLRDNMKGGLIRLQSRQYPIQNSTDRMYHHSKDLNDPRTRASIYVDITVNSNLYPLDGGYNVKLTMASCFVHTMQSQQSQQNRSAQQKHSINENMVNEIQGTFAWVLFTAETVHQFNVHQGIELRIYDIICIPTAKSLLKLPISSSIMLDNNETSAFETTNVKWVITCTQLCELYPSHVLSPLPDIPLFVIPYIGV